MPRDLAQRGILATHATDEPDDTDATDDVMEENSPGVTPSAPLLDVRALRRQLTLTRRELAETLRVSERTVTRWENPHARTGRRALPHPLYVEHMEQMWRSTRGADPLPTLVETEDASGT